MQTLLLLAAAIFPQGEVLVDATVEPASVQAGATVELRVGMDIPAGWHVYHPDQDSANGITVSVEVEGAEAAGKLACDKAPRVHRETIGSKVYETLWLFGSPEFTLPIKVEGPPGVRTLGVEVGWQICNESLCLPPESTFLSVSLEVLPGEAGAVKTGGPEVVPGAGSVQSRVQEKMAQGLLTFLLAAALAGLATLATPCVFPMIPITVSFFTKRSESGMGSPLGNAAAYGLGIILTFAGLGLGASLALGAGGANLVASNPWLNLGLAAMFLILAFSLLGFYEIRAPRFLENFAARTQAGGRKKSGYGAVVLMAVAFTVTAFTCTVGFVGGLLALAAGTADWLYILSGMLVYATVFALPFFLLALFPSALQKMPQAGGWMNGIKVSMGWLEIVAAWKFLSNADLYWDWEILTRPVVVWITLIPFVLWALYLFGVYKTPGDLERARPGPIRMVLGLGVVALAFYVGTGLSGKPYAGPIEGYFPPASYGKAHEGDFVPGPAEMNWWLDYQAAFAQAVEEDKPLFVDFTGVSCINCRRMEGNIFPHPEVRPLLEQFVRAELWVDKPPFGEWNMSFQIERFNTSQQPLYVVVDPRKGDPSKGQVVAVLDVFPGYDPDPNRFAAFLRKGLDGR